MTSDRTRSPGRTQQYYPGLDGLRAIAAVSVVIYHFGGGATSSSRLVQALSAIHSVGWMGVDLFFVLSGFLITGVLNDTRGDDHYLRNFFGRRALRIFPAFWLTWLVVMLVFRNWGLGQFLVLGYVGTPVSLVWPGLSAGSGLSHAWSLAIEEQFYLAWPFVVGASRRPSTLIAISTSMVVVALALRIFLVFVGASNAWTYAFLFCRMDELALGAILAVLFRTPARDRLLRWGPALTSLGVLGLIAIGVFRKGLDRDDAVMATVGYDAIGLTCAGLVLWALADESLLNRGLRTPWLRFLGQRSYGLYLFHIPMQAALVRLQPAIQARTSYFASFAIIAVVGPGLSFVLALASYAWLETPILRLRRLFRYTSAHAPLMQDSLASASREVQPDLVAD